MIPIFENLDGVVAQNPTLFPRQPILYLPNNYAYCPSQTAHYQLVDTAYINEVSLDTQGGKKCLSLYGASPNNNHQTLSYMLKAPVTSNAPVWQWAVSWWGYTGKGYYAANANMRWLSVYFADPEEFDKPDFFTDVGNWWSTRKNINWYLGKTQTTDNFRLRNYCDSYTNGVHDSGMSTWQNYTYFPSITDVAWHCFTVTCDGTTLNAYCDNASNSITDAFPTTWVENCKGLVRIALCQNNNSNNPNPMYFGTVRAFDYSLTQQQHLALYIAGF